MNKESAAKPRLRPPSQGLSFGVSKSEPAGAWVWFVRLFLSSCLPRDIRTRGAQAAGFK